MHDPTMHQEITDAMLQELIEKVGRHYQEDWAQQALERDTLLQETADGDPALLIGATSGTNFYNSDLAEQLERCKAPPRYRDITFEEIHTDLGQELWV